MGASAMRMPAGPACWGRASPGPPLPGHHTRWQKPSGTAGGRPPSLFPSGWAMGRPLRRLVQSRLAREAWSQGSRLPSQASETLWPACARVDRSRRLHGLFHTGSDDGVIAAPPVGAGLTDGQPARVGWRDAGPCQGAQLTLASLWHDSHTHLGHRQKGGWTGGCRGHWVPGVACVVPTVTGSGFKMP